MAKTLDLATVRQFTEELEARQHQCDTGEGMVCSNLDETIHFYTTLCDDLQKWINQWARAVFTGEVALDPVVEKLLKSEAVLLLDRAKAVAALGRVMKGECFELDGLDKLHFLVAALSYLVENWVTPQRAASPAPRVNLSKAVEHQIIERLKQLSPMPSDWRPTYPEQIAVFGKRGG